ncbi:acyl carrier protein [Micromonospora sp. NBC_01796]|uniref:acyl carrier protein n=1 Tax=Micromonospora sp. NBC_01796 TaxID=2975987 RepID=UPI002DDBEE1B|nr:phosphopantetheine-binding protein [Micromonospora sp. NBC_01796]WSA86650.1 phosphopantetheine-binding protein [Micromonospora sp. NBC_01796]
MTTAEPPGSPPPLTRGTARTPTDATPERTDPPPAGTTAPAPVDVAGMPRAQRRRAVEELLLAELREVLLLPEDAEVPRQVAFFDLGMTSLRVTELRQRLVRGLGRRLDLETLFEHTTFDRLLDHLATVAGATADAGPGDTDADRASTDVPPPMLDAVLKQLYR